MNFKNQMRTWLPTLVFAAFAFSAPGQTEHFVWKDNPGTPTPPFTNWVTAAHDIQSAIDTSAPGAVIWVTNGVYNTGGVSNYPTRYGLTNRVAIHKPVTVRSVNGPGVTCIEGRWHVPGDTGNRHGSNAVRCVWMTNGAALIGFCISNGATSALGDNANLRAGGGLLGQSGSIAISNCVFVNCSAAFQGGGGYRGIYYDCLFHDGYAGGQGGGASDGYGPSLFQGCVFSNNYAASQFGGAFAGHGATIFSNCVFAANSANLDAGAAGYGGTHYYSMIHNNTAVTRDAGGVSGGSFYESEIYNNTAARAAGGASGGTFYNCEIYGNTCLNGYGGGLNGSTAHNSLIYSNASSSNGKGAYGSMLYGCRVFGNMGEGVNRGTNYYCVFSGNAGYGIVESTAFNSSIVGNNNAGVRYSRIYNCTVAGNNGGISASAGPWVYNSIVYYNNNNYSAGIVFSNSCTFPEVPGWAEGNITNAPQFVDPGSAAAGYGTNYVIGNYRLTKESPCLNNGLYYDWMAPGDEHGRDTDLDGGPRIRHHIVDMGAYETRLKRGTIFTAE